ncbi:unnamed protein product, partial [Didymodactylos carnosus]
TESPLIVNRPQSVTDQFYTLNEMAIRGFAPKPVLSFDEAPFTSQMKSIVHRLGYQRPTAIQSQAWPVLLSGSDLFMIPGLIHAAGQSGSRHGDPIVLVLAPTRELAQQIQSVCNDFCSATNARSVCVYGGAPKPPQKRDIRHGLEVCIATPGRLLDFVREKTINLDRVTYLVLDEADRMLDMGFEPQIRKIIRYIRPDRQTSMFSATWPKEVQKLAEDFMSNCSHITLGKAVLNANQNIHQIVDVCEENEKESKLAKVLAAVMREQDCKVIIFAQTKKRVDDFFFTVKRLGYPVFPIHGDKRQQERDRVLSEFRNRPRAVLIATDVAARGLDVEDVRVVINLDYPPQAEDYIHRIGRTARSNMKGTSYTFFTRENGKQANELIQLLKDSNQDVNEKLYEIAKTKYFSGGRGGMRGGFDRRGYGGNRSGFGESRGGFGNNRGGSRPGGFSAKRSRSRSPIGGASKPQSGGFERRGSGFGSHGSTSDRGMNSNGYGNDFKRPRTDESQSQRKQYSSSSNGTTTNYQRQQEQQHNSSSSVSTVASQRTQQPASASKSSYSNTSQSTSTSNSNYQIPPPMSNPYASYYSMAAYPPQMYPQYWTGVQQPPLPPSSSQPPPPPS